MRKSLVVPIIISMFFLTGCTALFQAAPSEKVERYQDNYEIIGSEKDEMLKELSQSETMFETSNRSNPTMEEPYYFDVVNEEEFQLPSGRYRIFGEVSGNVYIHDEVGSLVAHEVIGYPGVPSITVDIDESHTISIDGLENAGAAPVPTELSTQLSTGIWKVGLDIEPGTYSIKSDGGFGHILILDRDGDSKIYEVISGQFASTESTIQLNEGQTVKITGISMINFQPVEG